MELKVLPVTLKNGEKWGMMGAVGVKFTNEIQLDVFPRSLEIIEE